MLEHVDGSQPSHEEKVIVLEELDRLLQGLPQELRQIVLWKLDGFTNAEIACSIGRTVRCVELKMQLIRKRLEQKGDHLRCARGDGSGGLSGAARSGWELLALALSSRSASQEAVDQDSRGDGHVERASSLSHGDRDSFVASREPFLIDAAVFVAQDQGPSELEA